MKTKEKLTEKERCKDILRKILPPGSTVKTIVRHVSRSGMQREISCIFNDECIDYYVGKVCDRRIGKHNGLVIGGCGMDMGFAIVYELSYHLYDKGYQCSGANCGAAVHVNEHTPKDGKTWHKDGYALHQRWI